MKTSSNDLLAGVTILFSISASLVLAFIYGPKVGVITFLLFWTIIFGLAILALLRK